MKHLLNIDFGCIEVNEAVLTCSKCKSSLESAKRAKSLKNHLMTILGFVTWHNEHCKGEKLLKNKNYG